MHAGKAFRAGTNKEKKLLCSGKMGKKPNFLREQGAKAISISGNDVYIAGFERNAEAINIAVIWKNGQPTRLTNGKDAAGIYDMATSGQDVYVVGYLEGRPPDCTNGKTIFPPDVAGRLPSWAN